MYWHPSVTRPGEFRIAARVDGVQYDYAPAALLPPGAPAPWSALDALSARGVHASIDLPELPLDDWLAQQPGASASSAAQATPWLPGQWMPRA